MFNVALKIFIVVVKMFAVIVKIFFVVVKMYSGFEKIFFEEGNMFEAPEKMFNVAKTMFSTIKAIFFLIENIFRGTKTIFSDAEEIFSASVPSIAEAQFHTLAFDGVYYEDSEKELCFKKLPPPSDEEVSRVMKRTVKRIKRLLERRGLGSQSDPNEVDPLLTEQPLLAELYGASVQGRVATGSKVGERIATAGIEEEFENKKGGRRCANLSGFSLHANVGIPAKARRQLEMICRYVARPPIAMERLSKLPDGRMLYQLRHRWRNGATHVIFEPHSGPGPGGILLPDRPEQMHLEKRFGIGRNRIQGCC